VLRAVNYGSINFKKKCFFQSGFSNAIDLLDDSDEEKSSKQDFILACVLVSEYL